MLLHTVAEVKEKVNEWKKQGVTVGLVPTMGALHKGHLSLIKKSVEKCDKTVVSVFVNPIQFCPGEDLDKYPRTLEADEKLCNDAGVDIVQPDFAFFGEKDRQQLIILKKMVKDLNIPVEIIPCPIVREESGLALSSRNKYLSEEDKVQALALSKILFNIKACYNKGINDVKALTETAYSYLNESHSLEYLEFRDADNLEEKQTADDNTIVFIALKIKDVRLIDNIALA